MTLSGRSGLGSTSCRSRDPRPAEAWDDDSWELVDWAVECLVDMLTRPAPPCVDDPCENCVLSLASAREAADTLDREGYWRLVDERELEAPTLRDVDEVVLPAPDR